MVSFRSRPCSFLLIAERVQPPVVAGLRLRRIKIAFILCEYHINRTSKVGPSNLETLLATIPPYWAPMVKIFHERMGNPDSVEGLALLKAASPLYKADQISKPLLILQGANDPRVKQSESDQIVGAMKDAGVPVTYVLYPDEGHGFAKPNNNIAYTAIAENFLASVLGGRSEPIGDTVKASTAEILEGVEHVAGLADALAD